MKHLAKQTNTIFGHEYRAVITSMLFFFSTTGLVDALIKEDWTLKSFLWAGIIIAMVLFISYELMFYETPKYPFMECLILMLSIITGLMGVHACVWYSIFNSMGGMLTENVWLAPGVIIPKTWFIWITITSFISYIVILINVNYLGVKFQNRII